MGQAFIPDLTFINNSSFKALPRSRFQKLLPCKTYFNRSKQFKEQVKSVMAKSRYGYP